MRKKFTPLPEPTALEQAECLALTELTRLGEPKCLYGVTFGPVRRVTLPSKKGVPARR